jgi:L-idonate 5-dehydrogenase
MTLTCRIHGAHDLRLEDLEAADLGPHGVRLRLGAAGICGSDLHYWQHGRVGAFQVREPLIPGHEASGVVEAVGAEVSHVRAGDRVAINPSHPCGRCDYCRAGRGNLCRAMYFLGSASVFPHAQGLFREQFVMDEAQLTPITEVDVSLGEIACAEPLSIGLHALHRAGPVLGETVLITGGGTIGCMSVIAARLAGAARVIVCDVMDRPLDMARQAGADEVIRSDQIDPKTFADRADVAIECAGHPSALATCLTAAKRGARVMQVGTLPAEIPFPANSVMARELDYRGVFRAHLAFDWAVQAIRSRRVDVRPLISAQMPLADAAAAFALAADKTRSTKVQLIPS